MLVIREMFVDLFILQRSFSGAAAMDQLVYNTVGHPIFFGNCLSNDKTVYPG